jgi:16S rRNA (cytosine967-C5)-methyltransferase
MITSSPVAVNAWRITGASDQLKLLMRQGRLYLQDEGSQLVSQALDPQVEDRILDLCAAPGSKSTHMAALTKDRAMIIAGDSQPHRLQVVAKSAALQRLSSIKCVVLNGLGPLPFVFEVFDRALVDAPCSGTGTLRRNPEIRWRIRAEDISSLAERQRHLLSNAALMVRPGGRLVYSTCSVEPEENEEVARAFQEQHRAFVMGTSIRTWPHRHGTDGFFITIFENARQGVSITSR